MILRTITGTVFIDCTLDKIQEVIISEIKKQHPEDIYLQNIELMMEDIVIRIQYNGYGGIEYEIKEEA